MSSSTEIPSPAHQRLSHTLLSALLARVHLNNERKTNIMNLLNLLDFVNLFFSGMLAGIEFVIHYGVREPAEQLPERSQLQLRKALVLKLRVLVPAFFAPTAILGITLTALNGSTPGFAYRCVGVVALLIWIAIRIVGTVPINSATVDWQLDSPPGIGRRKSPTPSASILLESGRLSWPLPAS
jgi:hypothetical protein